MIYSSSLKHKDLNFFFRDRVSLCSPGCPGTHFVDQAGLELRNPPASASHVLGLKACTTTTRLCCHFLSWEVEGNITSRAHRGSHRLVWPSQPAWACPRPAAYLQWLFSCGFCGNPNSGSGGVIDSSYWVPHPASIGGVVPSLTESCYAMFS